MNMGDIDEGRSLALNGSLQGPQQWLIAIMLIAMFGTIVAVTLGLTKATPQTRLPLLVAATITPLIVALALVMVLRSLRRARVYIAQGELVIQPGFGGKRIALSALRKHGLSVVDLNERTDLKPMIRLWGTGLPGFAGGRFRLRNGETAVCLLLERNRVSYLRSDDGTSVLLSLREPEKLRAALER
jgi:hypothetical protein